MTPAEVYKVSLPFAPSHQPIEPNLLIRSEEGIEAKAQHEAEILDWACFTREDYFTPYKNGRDCDEKKRQRKESCPASTQYSSLNLKQNCERFF